MSTENPHWGTNLDAFLAEDGMLESAQAEALTRVVAWPQLAQAMKRQGATIDGERSTEAPDLLDFPKTAAHPGLPSSR